MVVQGGLFSFVLVPVCSNIVLMSEGERRPALESNLVLDDNGRHVNAEE